MAIQNANFNAGSFVKSGSKRVITCTSNSISGNFKYRFYLELIYDSKTYAYTFRPNANGYGLINIGKILQSIVEPISVQQVLTVPDADVTLTSNTFQQNIHSMPHTIHDSTDRDAYLSTGGKGCKRIQVKLWDFYAATASAVPSRQGSAVTDYYYVIGGYQTSTGLLAETFDNYKLTGNTKEYISPLYCEDYNATQKQFDVALTDFGTISFLNRTADVNASAEPYDIAVSYYSADGTLLGQTLLDQDADHGGKYDASGVTDDSMILTLGCFPANLNKLDASLNTPSDFPTLAYYTILTRAASNAQTSKAYRFNIVNRCAKFDAQRFAYINSFGVWEYITFNKKRVDKISKKTTEIKSSVFDYSKSYATITPAAYQESSYIPGVAHESRMIKATNSNASFTVNTGYLSDVQISKIKEMFLAPKINYINTDGTALAVILTNKSIESVDVSHKHEQTEYALTFDYSVPKYNDIIF